MESESTDMFMGLTDHLKEEKRRVLNFICFVSLILLIRNRPISCGKTSDKRAFTSGLRTFMQRLSRKQSWTKLPKHLLSADTNAQTIVFFSLATTIFAAWTRNIGVNCHD